jgi:hypothetical protein
MNAVDVGPLRVKMMVTSTVSAVPMSGGIPIEADHHLAFITGPDGIALETAYFEFSDNSRDVRVIETGDTPNPYLRLGHGGRLGVYEYGDQLYCELRAMKLKDGAWSNLQRTTPIEIESWLGASLNSFLDSVGATSIQTREELFGDTGRRRNEIAAGFSRNNRLAPLAIYALTRPLPLLRGAISE